MQSNEFRAKQTSGAECQCDDCVGDEQAEIWHQNERMRVIYRACATVWRMRRSARASSSPAARCFRSSPGGRPEVPALRRTQVPRGAGHQSAVERHRRAPSPAGADGRVIEALMIDCIHRSRQQINSLDRGYTQVQWKRAGAL